MLKHLARDECSTHQESAALTRRVQHSQGECSLSWTRVSQLRIICDRPVLYNDPHKVGRENEECFTFSIVVVT